MDKEGNERAGVQYWSSAAHPQLNIEINADAMQNTTSHSPEPRIQDAPLRKLTLKSRDKRHQIRPRLRLQCLPAPQAKAPALKAAHHCLSIDHELTRVPREALYLSNRAREVARVGCEVWGEEELEWRLEAGSGIVCGGDLGELPGVGTVIKGNGVSGGELVRRVVTVVE
ncbi:hypothetical protein C0991_010756 [Blastosporella zonata]|nr:hypothetical protein C0991_010756 [Blastosporella zonata]